MRSIQLTLLVLLASACEGPEPPPSAPDARVPTDGGAALDGATPDGAALDGDAGSDAGSLGRLTFTEDVYPVFVSSGCASSACHGSPLPELSPDGAGLLFYLGTPDVAGRELSRVSLSTGRPFVVPGAPDASELVLHARDTNVPAGVLSVTDLATLEAWVRQGALRGPESAPRARDPEPATCALAGFGIPPLPTACLPRCAAGTWERVIACRSEPDPVGCQAAAFAEDPTPPIALGTAAGTLALGCGACASRQTDACMFDACPDDMLAFFRCLVVDGGECGAELGVLQACATGSPTFRECQRARDLACVAE